VRHWLTPIKFKVLAHVVSNPRPDTFYILQVVTIPESRIAFTAVTELLPVSDYRLRSFSADTRQPHQTFRRGVVRIYFLLQLDFPDIASRGRIHKHKTQAKRNSQANGNNKREQMNPVHPEIFLPQRPLSTQSLFFVFFSAVPACSAVKPFYHLAAEDSIVESF
jgi:hypothetical protein